VSRAPTRRVVFVSLAIAMVVAACSGAPDDATVPKERRTTAFTYVSLGGDDAAGARGRFGNAWPHVLFRTALPRSAQLVDLGTRRSGIGEIGANQVDRAVAARPDLVTLTLLDDAERGNDPDRVAADLGAVLDRLRARKAQVLVGTIPDDAADPATVSGLDTAIRAAAAGRPDVTVVDLGAVGRPDTPSGAIRTARAFARAVRAVGVSPARSP
jgi:GDSL-like Lipase/Acylhydrolase family